MTSQGAVVGNGMDVIVHRRLLWLLMPKMLLLTFFGIADCTSIALKDQPPQMKENYETKVYAELAKTARVICPVYGTEDRKPLVTWSRNGSLVHIGWDRYRTSRAGLTLLIDNAAEFDNGVYTCSASNGFGTVAVSLQLTVLPAANFTVHSQPSSGSQSVSRDSSMTSSNTDDEDDDDSAKLSDDVNLHVVAVTSSFPVAQRGGSNEAEYDIVMTSLMCMGGAIVLSSLAALIATAIRRRVLYRRRERLEGLSELAAHHLFGTSPTNSIGDKPPTYLYYPAATITSCSTLIGSRQVERHEPGDQSMSPVSVAVTPIRPCCERCCGVCASANRQMPTGQHASVDAVVRREDVDDVRSTSTWPQTATECQCPYCYSPVFNSVDSCASV